MHKRQRNPNGQSTIDDPEKLQQLGAQDRDKQQTQHNTHGLDINMHKQTPKHK